MSSGNSILRTPHEASNVYNLGGAHAPRQHHMFAVCFHKAGASASSATGWTKDLSFLIKNVDRPSVEPKIEEVNQYNKKRLLHTGYKIGPTRMAIYDTADSTAMQMFAEYAKYYFGDFRHAAAETDWNSDVIQNTMNGADSGYGFAPTAASTGADEFNAQFFFDSVSVYQVFGGKFVQYDLIRPRISSFNPDELDYSSGDASVIQITLQCEAIVYINDFQPQPISSDAFLSEAFGSGAQFDGDVVDYASSDSTDPTTTNNYATITPQSYSIPVSNAQTVIPAIQAADTGVSSGTLAPYGVYNFGSTAVGASTTSTTQSLSSDLSQAALANPLLATALTLGAAQLTGVPDPSAATPFVRPNSISQETLDQATAAIAAAGLNGGTLPDNDFASSLVYGAISAGAALGQNAREMVFNRSLPSAPAAYAVGSSSNVRQYRPDPDQVTYPIAALLDDGSLVPATASGQSVNSWNSADGRGLMLSPYAYGVLNAQRSATAQIGLNTRSNAPYSNRFGTSPAVTPKSI